MYNLVDISGDPIWIPGDIRWGLDPKVGKGSLRGYGYTVYLKLNGVARQIAGWMDGWTNGWTDGRTNGQMDR